MTGTQPTVGGRPFDRAVIVLLILLGAFVAFAPSALGWGKLRELGLEVVALRVLVGFLFFFTANAIVEKGRLSRRVDEVFEALNMLLYGKSYQADREAVRILLVTLSSKDSKIRGEAWEHLKRLTGQNFALDPEVWQTWWSVHEKRFARKTRSPED